MNAAHKYFLCTPYLCRIHRVFIALLSAGWTWVKRELFLRAQERSVICAVVSWGSGEGRGASPCLRSWSHHTAELAVGSASPRGRVGPVWGWEAAGRWTGSAPSGDKVLLCS